MSASPREAQEEGGDKQSPDELEEPQVAGDAEGGSAAPPIKRGRGRPKGSKNKKSGTMSEPATSSSALNNPPRKRGRPPKEKKDDSGGDEPPAKRKRGRPPKNPKPEAVEGGTSGDVAEPTMKKKRGRPKKVST